MTRPDRWRVPPQHRGMVTGIADLALAEDCDAIVAVLVERRGDGLRYTMFTAGSDPRCKSVTRKISDRLHAVLVEHIETRGTVLDLDG